MKLGLPKVPKNEKSATASSKRLGWVLLIGSFVVGGILWLDDTRRSEESSQPRVPSFLALPDPSVSLALTLESREADKLKIKCELYDLSGSEIASIEKTLEGGNPVLDSIYLPLRPDLSLKSPSLFLIFPWRLGTEQEAAGSGLRLFDAYNQSGFPELYSGISWTETEKKDLSRSFAKAISAGKASLPRLSEDSLKPASGYKTIKLAGLKTGSKYWLHFHPDTTVSLSDH